MKVFYRNTGAGRFTELGTFKGSESNILKLLYKIHGATFYKMGNRFYKITRGGYVEYTPKR